jgi:hypothetical protein
VWVDLGVHPTIDQMGEYMPFEKLSTRGVVFVGRRDKLRKPVRVSIHPTGFSGGETRVSFNGPRIVDVVGVERGNLPLSSVDLIHTNRAAELVGEFRKGRIAFGEEEIAGAFGGALVDTDPAPAHFET